MERLQLLEDLLDAYYDARKNKRNTVNQLRFEFKQEHEIITLCDEILSRTYEIRPSICFIVDKPVKREIFAADFRDRVIHHLLFKYINPLLDKQFIDDSYSCRKGRGTHFGINRVAGFLRQCSEDYAKDCYILKLDLSGYFMSINKHLLWSKLEAMLNPLRYIPLNAEESSYSPDDYLDYDLVWYLLKMVIWNDPTHHCIMRGKLSDWYGLPSSKSLFYSATDCGLPIGNLSSQLFSNVYLHDFDCFVKQQLGIEYYGRYVDDFIIIHPDKSFLLSAKKEIDTYLHENCGLKLHPKKIYLQHCSKGVAFLGAFIKPYRIYAGKRMKHNFFLAVQKTDRLFACMAGKEYEQQIRKVPALQKVRASLNSYLGILRHYHTHNIRHKTLMNNQHAFFKYGYLDGKLTKYSVSKKWFREDIKQRLIND